MADTAAPPQTPPPRKLFKPSSGRKTPTMVKKLRSNPSSPASVRVASGSPESLRKPPPSPSPSPSIPTAVPAQQLPQQQPQGGQKRQLETQGVVAREPLPSQPTPTQTTPQEIPSKSVSEPPRPLSQNVDDVIGSTKLAPLTNITDVASDKKQDHAVASSAAPVAAPAAAPASDTTRGTSPIGLIDRDFPTPSLEATTRELEDDTKIAGDSEDKSKLPHGQTPIDPSPSAVPAQSTEKQPDLPKPVEVKAPEDTPASAANQQEDQETASTITDQNTSQTPSPLPGTINRPADIAAYFARQGNPEMSKFVQELAGAAQLNPKIATADLPKDLNGFSRESTQEENDLGKDQSHLFGDRENKVELDQKADATANLTDQGDSVLPSDAVPSDQKGSPLGHSRTGSIKRKASAIATDAPKEATEVKQPVTAKGPVTFQEPDIELEEPTVEDTDKTDNQVQMANDQPGSKAPPFRRRAANAGNQAQRQAGDEAGGDGTNYFDNMGSPAHIERSVEIPIPKIPSPGPKESPPAPEKPDLGDIDSLPTTDDLADTSRLRSVDELSDIPEDPPEVMLDPKDHSPGSSSSITPIPKIPGIPSMDDSDELDLAELAEGLVGNTIDDIGNIVDELGEILGHVIGDLPAMVGREVSESGEVYGDDGEVLGRISENFTTPPPIDLSQETFGHLRVDHKGNILDGDGNIIGQMNQKPSLSGTSTPRNQSPKPEQAKAQSRTKPPQRPQDSDKGPKSSSKVGSPSDICLDVKSTNDGIQLIIRIPTMFSEAHKNCGHANCTN